MLPPQTESSHPQVNPLLLELEGCDCESDSPHLFNVDEPSGEYKLDLSLPYSRMVASELLALSESKKGYEVRTHGEGAKYMSGNSSYSTCSTAVRHNYRHRNRRRVSNICMIGSNLETNSHPPGVSKILCETNRFR